MDEGICNLSKHLNHVSMLVLNMLHFWPSNSPHLDLITSICFLYTCAYTHRRHVSSKWCVGHLITKTLRNVPRAHFPFNLPLFGDLCQHIKSNSKCTNISTLCQNVQIDVKLKTNWIITTFVIFGSFCHHLVCFRNTNSFSYFYVKILCFGKSKHFSRLYLIKGQKLSLFP